MAQKLWVFRTFLKRRPLRNRRLLQRFLQNRSSVLWFEKSSSLQISVFVSSVCVDILMSLKLLHVARKRRQHARRYLVYQFISTKTQWKFFSSSIVLFFISVTKRKWRWVTLFLMWHVFFLQRSILIVSFVISRFCSSIIWYLNSKSVNPRPPKCFYPHLDPKGGGGGWSEPPS